MRGNHTPWPFRPTSLSYTRAMVIDSASGSLAASHKKQKDMKDKHPIMRVERSASQSIAADANCRPSRYLSSHSINSPNPAPRFPYACVSPCITFAAN